MLQGTERCLAMTERGHKEKKKKEKKSKSSRSLTAR